VSAPAIAFEDVAVSFGARAVLRGVSLALAAGEVLGLAGPNGAGKTTLFRAATRVVALDRGEVRIAGTPVSALTRRELARRIAVVPQDVAIPFPFRAGEVVLMGRAPHRNGFAFESAADVERARACLALVGIESLADRPMSELSGGERQLVLVARALAQDPDVLLLDEPTAHLDLRHRAVVIERVREFAHGGGAALVVSHDLTLAARSCGRLALLAEGSVTACGAPAEVLQPLLLARVFGVEAEVLTGPDGAPIVVPHRATTSPDIR
jgi:ABC-type cobalamin/Fe3+-siderophores transport system ATPase subunit